MIWGVIVFLVILWLLGLVGHVGGNLVWLILIGAIAVLIVQLSRGRR